MIRWLPPLAALLLLGTSAAAAQSDHPRVALPVLLALPESLRTTAARVAAELRESIRANSGLQLIPSPYAEEVGTKDSLRRAMRAGHLQDPTYVMSGELRQQGGDTVWLTINAADVRTDQVVSWHRLKAVSLATIEAAPDSLIALVVQDIAVQRARRRGRGRPPT